MSRLAFLQPLADAVRGDQRRPTVILLLSVVLMVTWKYGGSREFYQEHFSRWLSLGSDPAVAPAVYYFASCFLLLGVVPALTVRWVFRQRLADYGVQLGDRVRTVRSLLVFAPLFVFLAYLASRDPAIRAWYPINRAAGASPAMFALNAATYLLFYLGWEFHFRGFLQFGLRDKLGTVNALLVQVMASSLLHIGRPGSETFAAIGAGIFWGILAFRTRSLLSGLMQHYLLGVALDWFLCYL